MPVIINGVSCEELVGEFSEGIGAGGPFARKGYLCDWGDRYQLANGLLGLSSRVGGTGISITHPASYPESANMYAREIDIAGAGRPSQGAKQVQWPFAIVRVNFGVPTFGVLPSDDPGGGNSLDQTMPLVYATQEIEFAVESMTLSGKSVKLANGHKVDRDFGFRTPRADMTVSLHRYPYIPGTLILNTLKSPLNNATFLNCEPGKCLFNGAKVARSASTDGTFTQDVTFSFSYRPIAPWDQVFDSDGTSGWQQVQDNSGNPIIPRSDLSVLFTAPYRYL